MSESQVTKFVIRRPSATNVVKRVCDELGLAEAINAAVPGDPDAWKLAPGEHAVALVVNVLSTQTPLYRVREDFAKRDVQALFGVGAEPGHLNDNALGRSLERMAQCDLGRVFSQVACNGAVKEGFNVQRFHGDTTTLSVQGAYEAEGAPINIAHGYSTDKRPDLKQILMGLIVTQEGYPVAADTRDGNLTPKTWQLTGLDLAHALSDQLGDDWIYVADSALVTADNLKRAKCHNVKFISRVPANNGIVERLRVRAWQQDEWEDLGRLSGAEDGAQYKIATFHESFNGDMYRFVVVQSSALDARKAKHLQKKIDDEQRAMEKALDKLSRRTFACEPDAQAAQQQFASEWAGCFAQPVLHVRSESKRKPGRPPKNGPAPTRTIYRIEGRVDPPDEAVVDEVRRKLGTFVLITNVLDEAEFTNLDVLQEYKGQSHVEGRFRFLKDPVFVDSVYLKNQDRVYALGYVFLFALLVASLMELRVRRRLRERGEVITVPGRRKTDRPTIRAIFHIFADVMISLHGVNGRLHRELDADLDPRIPELLGLLGYDLTLYTDPRRG